MLLDRSQANIDRGARDATLRASEPNQNGKKLRTHWQAGMVVFGVIDGQCSRQQDGFTVACTPVGTATEAPRSSRS
jgi:hypothetical protein